MPSKKLAEGWTKDWEHESTSLWFNGIKAEYRGFQLYVYQSEEGGSWWAVANRVRRVELNLTAGRFHKRADACKESKRLCDVWLGGIRARRAKQSPLVCEQERPPEPPERPNIDDMF